MEKLSIKNSDPEPRIVIQNKTLSSLTCLYGRRYLGLVWNNKPVYQDLALKIKTRY